MNEKEKIIAYTERRISIWEVLCDRCGELTCKNDDYKIEEVLCLKCLLKKRVELEEA